MKIFKNKVFEHKDLIKQIIYEWIQELVLRAKDHDSSKLEDPEYSVFNNFDNLMDSVEFGSDIYYNRLNLLNNTLKHHYENNRHHPEHFKNGVKDMTLIDLIEMLADWKASVHLNKNGDLLKSIEICQKRFGFSDELKKIFINTII